MELPQQLFFFLGSSTIGDAKGAITNVLVFYTFASVLITLTTVSFKGKETQECQNSRDNSQERGVKKLFSYFIFFY